ncbi:MAG: FAD-dependent oxidoreductase [Planctomycetota bacterium]
MPRWDLDHLPARLPTPDLSDGRILRRVAGIRPYRRGSYRLEYERVGTKHVVHNYGHGGAGFTLSWGAAELAVDRLEAAVGPAGAGNTGRAAVLGGGVIGLSTARVLQERGWRVAVYAEHFATQTTSNRAGAQFAPSAVAATDKTELADMLRRAAVRFGLLAMQNVGVGARLNYTTPRGGGALSALPSDFLPSRTLARLPFAGVEQPGRVHATYLIEPPRYLPWLIGEVRRAGGRTATRRFADAAEAMRVPERSVINCLGLGAGAVFNDPRMQPIRGQLIHLEPQDLPYMLSHRGYLFPRSDGVVLGGSYERGQTEAVTTDRVCSRILRRHRAFFGVG